jgi:hypothetical protein
MGSFRVRNGSSAKELRGFAVAAMVLALGWTPMARAAGLKNVSVDEFRVDVTRLQGVVAGCGASAAACNADSVGDDVRVGDLAKGGFEEHWEWLRGVLKDSKTAKGGERAKMLREADARLVEMAQESGVAAGTEKEFERERAVANAELARPEFLGDVGQTWWDRLKARVFGWLQRLFEGVVQVGTAAPWLGTLLEWVFFVGAAVGLLFLLLRNLARQRLRVALGGEALQGSAWESEAEEWAQWAEEHAQAGEWREAVHCLYWAAIVLLEGRRAWRHNPTRTPREYVRLLKPGSAQQLGLRRLTQIFERVWYGLRATNEGEYAEARALYERLAESSAETVGSTNDAGGALPTGGLA